MKTDEGYIKFRPQWTAEKLELDDGLLDKLNEIRIAMIERGWLGVLPNGVGFGNLSVRTKQHEFLISGSATGHLPLLHKAHLSLVSEVAIKANTLKCKGETVASSESMSHAACYLANAEIAAVIHIHDADLWQQYIHKLPTSSESAAYGTPEMALSLSEIIIGHSGLMVMGGHQDGIIAYGKDLDNALELLKEL